MRHVVLDVWFCDEIEVFRLLFPKHCQNFDDLVLAADHIRIVRFVFCSIFIDREWKTGLPREQIPIPKFFLLLSVLFELTRYFQKELGDDTP
jgi:hypothetical protein